MNLTDARAIFIDSSSTHGDEVLCFALCTKSPGRVSDRRIQVVLKE